MGKRLIRSILMVAWLIIAGAPVVEAQSERRFAIDVPFDFSVAGRIFPAGRYTLGRLEPSRPNLLMIRNADTRKTRVFLAQRVRGGEQLGRTSNLVFLRRGRAYYLFQVWMSEDTNGNQLSTPNEAETRDRRAGASMVVRLMVNDKGP